MMKNVLCLRVALAVLVHSSITLAATTQPVLAADQKQIVQLCAEIASLKEQVAKLTKQLALAKKPVAALPGKVVKKQQYNPWSDLRLTQDGRRIAKESALDGADLRDIEAALGVKGTLQSGSEGDRTFTIGTGKGDEKLGWVVYTITVMGPVVERYDIDTVHTDPKFEPLNP